MRTTSPPTFGLLIIGDEILSGKRMDKHMNHVIELLGSRGLALSYVQYVGDEPSRITAKLRQAFESGDVVFSTGGIGATPDDHTRQCAAAAMGVDLHMHPQAKALILERMQDVAREQDKSYDPDREDNMHRLNMAMFPMNAQIIPNPYNKIAGFSCRGVGQGAVHFVPGFPVMAWPMIAWSLDAYYSHWFNQSRNSERSVIVAGAIEATLTPLMLQIEASHPHVKVFSLPSVDHPEYGRHIELGVKGVTEHVQAAYSQLLTGLNALGAKCGPEFTRP